MASKTLAERADILRPTGLAPLLNSTQLQARYGISNWTANEWRKNGCPVKQLPGGRRRYDLAEVDAWLAAQEGDAAEARAELSRKALAARA